MGGGGGAVLAENIVFKHVSPTFLIDISAFIELKFKCASLTFLFVSKKLQTLDKRNKNIHLVGCTFTILTVN